MKRLFIPFSLMLFVPLFSLQAQQNNTVSSQEPTEAEQHNAWLKQQFSEKHQKLIPKVAVADMLYACNKERQIEPVNFQLKELILNMDKARLANKLIQCLGDDDMQSEVALNFGLLGCFHDQLAHLPTKERQQKMALVEKAILSLDRSERKKSFTQCVTQQAIQYLQ